jgi:ABC-type dipeptide/oligopeptide/nickel transport system permease subunit
MQLDFIAQSASRGPGAGASSRALFQHAQHAGRALVTLQIGYVIIVEASLSFLGGHSRRRRVGLDDLRGREYVTSAWWA